MANSSEEDLKNYYKRGYNDGYITATKIAMNALKSMIDNLTKDMNKKEENETNL